MSIKAHSFVTRKPPRVFLFAGYTLDSTTGLLFRGAEELKLRPKSYQALKYLVENAGRLVSKAELLTELWPDAVAVSDDSLGHCIMDVRRVLNDNDLQLIRTLPGRGYMFSVPVDIDPESVALPAESNPTPRVWSISKRVAIRVGLALLGIAGIIWLLKNREDRNWVRTAVPRVEELAASGKYSDAYELALGVLGRVPGEPRVNRLMHEISDDLSVTTAPPGADVLVRRIGATDWQRLGTTPLEHVTMPRDEYILSIRKTGYASFERSLSTTLERSRPISRGDAVAPVWNKTPWEIRIDQELLESARVPQDMVLIPGGKRRLRSYARPMEARVQLDDYFLDKFEVSNRQFKAFIDGGDYKTAKFWEPGFYDSQLAQEANFNDKTGLPGPRGWVGGKFPDGKENHPVTGVTWHEALAYCRSHGKELPSLFQWEYAARMSMNSPFGIVFPWGLLDPGDISRRANFDSAGTTQVDAFEFGMSPFGIYNMAGNVAEWMRNPYDDGFTTAGGSWSDPVYRFASYGPRPPLQSADSLGFRCAVPVDRAHGEAGAMRFESKGRVFHYPISTDSEFLAAKSRYDYQKAPLHAEVLATVDTEQWRRDEIVFDGFGGERAKAFLYLPKNAAPPYQVIHFLSGAAWWFGVPVTDEIEGANSRLAPYIRTGRAVFLVVLKGFAGREGVGAFSSLESGSAQHREILKSWVVDMRRGIDYLESRPDIDKGKIAFWNNSSFEYGAVFTAVDNRSSSIIVIGASADPWMEHLTPDVNPLHFVPHIRVPKLMLNGLYDDRTPERTGAEPLFQLMREPKKRVRFEGGHIPPPEIAIPLISDFLDETLGPVRRSRSRITP